MPLPRLFSLVTALAVLASPASADRLTVFAAASLKEALGAVAKGFRDDTGHEVVLSLAGSSALARQIAQGAPADVFLSANTGWMDQLEHEGRIVEGSRVDLLGNSLVLVAHDPEAAPVDLSPALDLPALLDGGKLAMALVDAVPVGIYGKAALQALYLWDAVAPQVAQADNARAALALVAQGAAPFGIVYATDAMAEPRVTVAATFPADSHPPITYPAAIVEGHDTDATRTFMEWLQGPSARADFAAHGFTVLTE